MFLEPGRELRILGEVVLVCDCIDLQMTGALQCKAAIQECASCLFACQMQGTSHGPMPPLVNSCWASVLLGGEVGAYTSATQSIIPATRIIES